MAAEEVISIMTDLAKPPPEATPSELHGLKVAVATRGKRGRYKASELTKIAEHVSQHSSKHWTWQEVRALAIHEGLIDDIAPEKDLREVTVAQPVAVATKQSTGKNLCEIKRLKATVICMVI